MAVTVNNIIAETGISKTVNNLVYTGVIHVSTSLSVNVFGAILPATSVNTQIDSYYAKKVSLIQSLNKVHVNYAGYTEDVDQTTNLQVAVIK